MNIDSSDEIAESGKPKSTLWPTLLLVAIACLGSLTLGYAVAYPSSALLELAELPGELAFEKGGAASELFVVSTFALSLRIKFNGDLWGKKLWLEGWQECIYMIIQEW